MITELIKLYERDLNRLEKEINAFTEESNLWRIKGNIINSAGNLCLHIIGNLKTYIGKNLGNIHYLRNRDAEFSTTGIPRESLIHEINKTKAVVSQSLAQMKATDLENTYKEDVLGYSMTNGYFLIHLSGHLNYHLGQINYLRRILEK